MRVRQGIVGLWLAATIVAAAGCARPLPAPLPPPPDVTFVIPRGTAAASMRGEPAFTIPSEIRLVAGQSISIRNDDVAMHYFAGAAIAPGQTLRKTFGTPGQFGYTSVLSCSVAQLNSVTIVVERPPRP